MGGGVAYRTLIFVKIYELAVLYINNMNIHLAITLLPKCFFRLKKGLSPKIRLSCFAIINSVLL